MGPRVAHVAIPEDEGGVGFDHLESVLAFAWLGHCNEAKYCVGRLVCLDDDVSSMDAVSTYLFRWDLKEVVLVSGGYGSPGQSSKAREQDLRLYKCMKVTSCGRCWRQWCVVQERLRGEVNVNVNVEAMSG